MDPETFVNGIRSK